MAYDIDAQKMTEVLRIGREKLSDKGTKQRQQAGGPDALADRDGAASRRDRVIPRHFRSRYRTSDSGYTDDELAQARALARSKFCTPEWIYRVP